MSRLAQALHVPPNRISGIVAGQRGITGETALRLARYFNTTRAIGSTCRLSMNSKPRATNGTPRSVPKYARTAQHDNHANPGPNRRLVLVRE